MRCLQPVLTFLLQSLTHLRNEKSDYFHGFVVMPSGSLGCFSVEIETYPRRKSQSLQTSTDSDQSKQTIAVKMPPETLFPQFFNFSSATEGSVGLVRKAS